MYGLRLSILPAAAASDPAVTAPMYRLLGVLAAYADKKGECFPSVGTLAADMHASDRWVQQLLRVLSSTPYLSVSHRPGRSSLYQINGVNSDFTPEPGLHPRSSTSPGGEPVLHGGVKQDFTHKDKPKGKPKDTDGAFEEFWIAYPSRGDHDNPKGAAKKAFAVAVKKGADPRDIIRGAKHFAADESQKGTDPMFVPQAKTWLRDERWTEYQEELQVGRREADPEPRSMTAA